jgi:hypothetical protein
MMARRGILDYVLGGAVGGLEGLAQQRAAEDEKKRLNDALIRQQGIDAESSRRQAMMDALALGEKGFTEAGVRQERTKAATPALSAMLNTAMSMGRGAAPSGVLPDMSAIEKAAGMYGKPVQSFEVGGKTYEKTLTKEQEAAMGLSREEEARDRQLQQAERVKAAEAQRVAEAKNAEMSAMKSAWEAAGLSPAKADVAARTGAKYGDVMMSDKDMQALGISRGQLKLAQDRFKFDQGKAEGESPRGEMMNGLQAMGKARAATALNLLETNTKIMKQFEDDLRAGKLQMTGVQVEAARKALAGTPGSALAEEALNKGNFLIDKNPALLRYIRAGKSIASAVREITPRGGSNLMMQMEIALSGIGPGGTDPESLAQVDAFRNDLLMGVRTGVEAMTGKRSGGMEGGGGTVNRGSKPALTIDEWMDANPQRSDESDPAYMARAKASREGK